MFDRLDKIAIQVAKGNLAAAGSLSTGETLYVALAANSTELLADAGYTIAEAIDRLGSTWFAELMERWKNNGNPKNF